VQNNSSKIERVKRSVLDTLEKSRIFLHGDLYDIFQFPTQFLGQIEVSNVFLMGAYFGVRPLNLDRNGLQIFLGPILVIYD